MQGCILYCAEMMDVVLKKGSWYSYGDNRLGQERDRALQYLRENPLLCDEIEKSHLLEMKGNLNHQGSLRTFTKLIISVINILSDSRFDMDMFGNLEGRW
ncbi:hypothetical protein HYC85_017454 [Camellia sinensis]|uniref:RecA-like C-terminal domain-containing protein n=1 Tax=Camellia sinensis TaxID=4442 RepID=A0A7J7GSF8_CAMSI|nr:hypothetical protein HYC85_017454 [Camellia sinensis]